jgi:hypothetical protein
MVGKVGGCVCVFVPTMIDANTVIITSYIIREFVELVELVDQKIAPGEGFALHHPLECHQHMQGGCLFRLIIAPRHSSKHGWQPGNSINDN